MSHKSASQKRINAVSRPDIVGKYSRANREEMIAVAAYFRAKNRGFESGHSMDDWLAAEAEIDAMLRSREHIH